MIESDNIEIIDNIDLAITLLKSGKLLLSNKTFFILKRQRILIMGSNIKYYLSVDEFKNLYIDEKFVVYEEKDENFDFSRDDEYYSWKHK